MFQQSTEDGNFVPANLELNLQYALGTLQESQMTKQNINNKLQALQKTNVIAMEEKRLSADGLRKTGEQSKAVNNKATRNVCKLLI